MVCYEKWVYKIEKKKKSFNDKINKQTKKKKCVRTNALTMDVIT